MPARVGRSEVDGVPVFFGETPGRAFGALMFRVGHADEILPRRGITHLVEHLALHPQDRRATDFNGYVDLTTTVFHCEADTLAAVGDFLTSVSRTLVQLPFDRMDKEAQVLRAEAAQRRGSAIGTSLWLRYGPTAFGTLEYEEMFLHRPSQQLMRAHLQRYFTRQNAAIVLSGPPPATLDLTALPAGARVTVPISLPVEQRFPAWTTANGNAVTFTCLLPRTPAVPATMFVISSVLRHLLREELAISYDVSTGSHVLSSTHAHHALRADCRLADAAEVAAHMQTELSRIIYEGCPPEELAEYQRERRRSESLPGSSMGVAGYLANEWLYGNESVDIDALDDEADRLTIADVQDVAQAIHDTAMWLVPDSAPISDRRVHLVTQWSTWAVNGTQYHQAPPQRNDDYLVAAYDGLSLAVIDRGWISISFDRIAACKQWSDGGRTLYGRDGFTLTVDPAEWIDGEQIVALIDRQVPKEFVIVAADRLRGR